MGTAADDLLEIVRRELGTAVLCDALDQLGFRHQSPRLPLPRLTGAASAVLAGRCRTTLWVDMAHDDPAPYELELRAVDGCLPGDVVVAAAGGSLRSGIWGDLLTTAARGRGCVGAVVDGAIRDVARIAAVGFPIHARGTSPYDSLHRQRVVDIDVTVEIDGVACSAGDLVVADADGIVIVPRAAEADALHRALDKVRGESQVRQALARGMSASEAYRTYGIL